MRITYAPGAALDIHWRGPVTYSIDQGALAVLMPKTGNVDIRSHGQGVGGGRLTTIPAGFWIFATDGYAGATRNDGATPTIVLVVTVITQQMTSVHRHESVTVPLGPATPTP